MEIKPQILKPVNLLNILPSDGDARDYIIYNLICHNRQMLIPIDLQRPTGFDNDMYRLIFTPSNNLSTATLDSSLLPFNYDVHIVARNMGSRIEDKKIFLCTMDCNGSSNTLSSINFEPIIGNPQYKMLKQTKFSFGNDGEFITNRFFNFEEEEDVMIMKQYPHQYVIIKIISQYISNLIASSYGIEEYDNQDFFISTWLENVKIDEKWLYVINLLLGKNKDNIYFNQKIDPMEYAQDYITLDSTTMLSDFSNLSEFGFDLIKSNYLGDSINNIKIREENILNKENITNFNLVRKPSIKKINKDTNPGAIF